MQIKSLLLSYNIAQKKYNNIHEAVASGDVTAVESMVKNGASINEVDDRDKFTPLHTACNSGALEVGDGLHYNMLETIF